jgi:hypothetical protein
MVQELQTRGWIEAVFETHDGRSVHGGHVGPERETDDCEPG